MLAACLVGLALGPPALLETESAGATHTEAYQVMRLLRDEFGMRLGNNLAIVLPDAPDAARADLTTALKRDFPAIRRLGDVPGRPDPPAEPGRRHARIARLPA